MQRTKEAVLKCPLFGDSSTVVKMIAQEAACCKSPLQAGDVKLIVFSQSRNMKATKSDMNIVIIINSLNTLGTQYMTTHTCTLL